MPWGLGWYIVYQVVVQPETLPATAIIRLHKGIFTHLLGNCVWSVWYGQGTVLNIAFTFPTIPLVPGHQNKSCHFLWDIEYIQSINEYIPPPRTLMCTLGVTQNPLCYIVCMLIRLPGILPPPTISSHRVIQCLEKWGFVSSLRSRNPSAKLLDLRCHWSITSGEISVCLKSSLEMFFWQNQIWLILYLLEPRTMQ